MTLGIDLSEAHEIMLERLRDEHDEGIDTHLRQVVEAEIHESHQQLRQDDQS